MAQYSATITIRFSRAAAPNLREMWQQRSPIDYSMWICRLTHCPFSHVDLLVKCNGREGLLGASNNPNAPVLVGNPCGVAVRPVDYQRFAIRHDAVITTTPAIKAAFEGFCLAQIGKPFDQLGLISFLSSNFERDWRSSNRWYCAEMLGRATEESNLMGYRYPANKYWLTSADLLLYLTPKIDFAKFRKPIGTTL